VGFLLLSPKFIKMTNSLFNKKERNLIRLALLKMLNEWVTDGANQEQITYLERLVAKFNDGKKL
jgi:hypothetical protein